MATLGIDLGSSSVKASLLDQDTGAVLGRGQFPQQEMPIRSPRPGWAEQDPADWDEAARHAIGQALQNAGASGHDVQTIGIAYQMHGLVCLDVDLEPVRPSIIWCDSRAVEMGRRAFEALGRKFCLARLLNSPGNFTAAKLAWVREHEPDIYARTAHFCLPGDYLAARLTGRLSTTVSGLSEAILWDFQDHHLCEPLLEHYGIDPQLVPDRVPTFGGQGEVSAEAARRFGFRVGTPLTYRAGDQPNNALSLKVLQAGEVAATAGTSGVVYGVSDQIRCDPRSRINSFAHVNHQPDDPRLGLLLCINGTGSALAWTRRVMGADLTYEQLNSLAASAPVGSAGVSVLPLGNGTERMLENHAVGGRCLGLDFNRHERSHLARAVQEGIACALAHGMQILRETGVDLRVVRAGRANLFLSPLFRQTLANLTGASIELYDTDGADGAARGAAIGAGLYPNLSSAFDSLQQVDQTSPDPEEAAATRDMYDRWSVLLDEALRASEAPTTPA